MAVLSRYFFAFILLLCSVVSAAFAQIDRPTNSWKEVKEKKSGTLLIYWYESKPFIFKKVDGALQGIEFDFMQEFSSYLKNKYGCELKVVWKEARTFADTYLTIRDGHYPGVLGSSAFTVTAQRQTEVDFAPPYMPDISVLITSDDVPIVHSAEEFNVLVKSLTAITIKQTTYEAELRRLKEDANLQFDIRYIPSRDNIVRAIEDSKQAFGFIDLPVYMMMFKESPILKVKRQNLLTIKQSGYAFVMASGSDWNEPLTEYFHSSAFEEKRESIIGRYIDRELFKLVEQMAIESNDLVLLLTKEKEIQHKNLVGKTAEIAKESRMRNFLIVFATIVVFFLVMIGILYRKRSIQKRQIELQQRSIEEKNKQLEKRNRNLIILDEEKNNLIKILAHDLRTPINHVQGLAQVFLLSNKTLPDEQKIIIDRISDASVRLNKMISNILDIDSIENNRIKLSKEKIMIGRLVENVVNSFDEEASRKELQLSLSMQTNGCLVEVDPLFMTQVLENLISNALKFSAKGKTVQVITQYNGNNIEIVIHDSGPGLSEQDKKLLFIKFQRLSARPTGGESSIGLGLSIVKRYVELMSGKVWCESEEGRGATFIVSFPKISEANRPA